METNVNDLIKPGAYHRRTRRVFKTYSALRYYLDHRAENGLLEAGAVIESPLGLLIDPERFDSWVLGRSNRSSV
jgi:hypothetical protein